MYVLACPPRQSLNGVLHCFRMKCWGFFVIILQLHKPNKMKKTKCSTKLE